MRDPDIHLLSSQLISIIMQSVLWALVAVPECAIVQERFCVHMFCVRIFGFSSLESAQRVLNFADDALQLVYDYWRLCTNFEVDPSCEAKFP